MGNIDFSPGVIEWKYKRDTWGLIARYHDGNKTNTAIIPLEIHSLYSITTPDNISKSS